MICPTIALSIKKSKKRIASFKDFRKKACGLLMSPVWPEDHSIDTASTSMGKFDSYADIVRSSSLRRSSSGEKQLLEPSLQVAVDVESGEPHQTIYGR
ncbi:hypothetical protein J6590_028889 [Homalodisca vitripennis]|nr:hypothetical protein J6590_028889 [Homalodisca vitripennis]